MLWRRYLVLRTCSLAIADLGSLSRAPFVVFIFVYSDVMAFAYVPYSPVGFA